MQHLADITSHVEKELGILQNADGDLKLILGKGTKTSLPKWLEKQGYDFVLHTHPEPSMPGVRDLSGRHSMAGDLLKKADEGTHHVEAVVSQNGDVRFFDHNGFVDPPEGKKYVPSGPVNDWGHIVSSVLGI